MDQDSKLLREQAEAALRKLNPDMDAVETRDMAKILEELYIHQIELEIQNDTLQTAYQELEQERSRYSNLYHTMPAGHLTLDDNGIVIEANSHASYLLGSHIANLIGKPFSQFFSASEQNSLHLHLRHLLIERVCLIDELRLETATHGQIYLQVISHPIHNTNPLCCHTILVDITEYKRRLMAEALQDTGILLTSTLDIDSVLQEILKHIGRIVPHDLALIALIEPGGWLNLRYWSQHQGEIRLHKYPIPFYAMLKQMLEKQVPVLISDMSKGFGDLQASILAGIKSCIIAPLQAGDESLGFLWLCSQQKQFFHQESFRDIASFARQASLAVNNARQHQESQELIRIQEREELAREFHDAVKQNIFGASLIADVLLKRRDEFPASAAQDLEYLHQAIQAALLESQILLEDLHPSHLLNLDERSAIHSLADSLSSNGIAVILDIQLEKTLPYKLKIHIYRILQEALMNIRKHAQTKSVRIRLHSLKTKISLIIQDKGQGFELNHPSQGLGLSNIRRRVDNSSGRLRISSKSGDGTCLAILWLLKAQ